MAVEERVMLTPAGHLTMPAWAPPFPPASPPQPPSPSPLDQESAPPTAASPHEPAPATWSIPHLRRTRAGPSRLIALVEASPAGAERLAAAVVREGQASGRTTIALALEPRGRLADALAGPTATDASPTPTQTGIQPIALRAPPEATLTPALLTERLAELQRRADLLVVDLGCRWVPALFRPVLSRADEIWLIGAVGQWGLLEARQSQAEFSGWTNLDRLSVFALGPPGTGAQAQPGGPITLLEVTEPSLTQFAQSYWRRQQG